MKIINLPQDYPFYIASAVCEWIVSFSFIFFFFTYIDEFKVSTGPRGHVTCFQQHKTCIFFMYFLQLFTIRMKIELQE